VFGVNIFENVQIAAWQSGGTMVVPGTMEARRLSLRAQFLKMLAIIREGVSVLGTSVEFWRYVPVGFQASIMYMSLHTPFLRLRYPHIRATEYFYHAGWSEVQCEDILQKVGWELPSSCYSTWRADCSFAEVKNYMFHAMRGATYADAFLSNMVRAGVLSREEAMRRIEEAEGKISKERIADVCRILELPDEVVKRLSIG
jgi:hypothetical protein